MELAKIKNTDNQPTLEELQNRVANSPLQATLDRLKGEKDNVNQSKEFTGR
jgi:hypothetical protein